MSAAHFLLGSAAQSRLRSAGLGVETSLWRYSDRYISYDGCYCHCCLIFYLFDAVIDIPLRIEAALEAAGM